MLAPVIVLSHLRWDFVFQRPQHLLSRLAQHRRVYFVEEPIHAPNSEPHWVKSEDAPNVVVCRPHTPVASPHFHDEQMPVLRDLLQRLVNDEKLDRYAVWFYTPMALPLLDVLSPKAVIFDVMDELSMFKGAPPELLQREDQLLKKADLVFTGGPSLYRAKKDRAERVYCFPSSVERSHFEKAIIGGGQEEAADQRDLPHPRLGFYGVIDERMDLGLLDAMATAHPDWQIVMVGPVVKISPEELPKHPNIHYVGQRKYQELPSYLAGWDVCLLPFARNDSTKFISPTKTVEYMAAEKMIVSTPITDVAEPYGHIVYLGDTHQQFIEACEEALAVSDEERNRRVALMHDVLSKTSWDNTAKEMSDLIRGVIEGKDAAARANAATVRTATPEPRPIVIGAGPTGLSATYHLGSDALCIEKNDSFGGWCRSIGDAGFTFDMAGHIMFSKDPYVHDMYKLLLGDNVHWQDREAWIYSKNVYTRYPFQGCLYGLPDDVITECIVGAIEARFGSLKADAEMEDAVAKAASANAKAKASNGNGNGMKAVDGVANPRIAASNGNGNGNGHSNGSNGHSNGNGNGHAKADASLSRCNVGDVKDCCGDGVMESEVKLVDRMASNGNGNGHDDGKPKNFEEFIYKVWGKGIAKHFAIPYNQKLWAVPLSEMETSWLGGRVPMPDIEEMIKYSLTPLGKPMGPNARFGYPLEGGFQALMDGFKPLIGDQVLLNTSVVKVSAAKRTVTTSDGVERPYTKLISTMPLPILIKQMADEAPPAVRKAAEGLRHISVRCVNIGVGREKLTDKHWIYYPEDTIFHRIFVQGNASPQCNPPGGFGITCEITYHDQYKPLPYEGKELIDRCIEDCIKVGMFNADDEIWCANEVDMPYAYVLYDHARARNVSIIREWLLKQDIILAGRYSEWEYYNSDHAFVAGRNAAEKVLSAAAAEEEAVAV